MTKSFRSVLLFAVVLLISSGCSIGYRHTVHGSTYTRDDGRTAKISGKSDSAYLAATFDFRYVRVLAPFEFGRRIIRVEDTETGFRDNIDLIRERRFWRADVPLLSIWDFENQQFGGYPGFMRHRHSLEFWLSAESDLRVRQEWWADISFVFYRYQYIGFRAYGGVGGIPFDAATVQPGSRFPYLWRGSAPYYGAGVEMIITAGEFGLDMFEYLLGVDRTHRDRSRRYGWD